MTRLPASINGQSLWEVIIALAIASLIAFGLVRATGSAVRGSRFSADQSQLTALAQERIAKIADYKNKNSNDFFGEDLNSFGSPDLVGSAGVIAKDTTMSDTCFLTAINSNDDWSGAPTPVDSNHKMAKITVDVYWGAKDSSSDYCTTTVDAASNYSHTLHFETNVTN